MAASPTVLVANKAVPVKSAKELVDYLKAKPGGELQAPGSGAMVCWLLENDLVDEITLSTVPVIVGQGARLFPEAGPNKALELVETRSTPGGVTIQVYRPTLG